VEEGAVEEVAMAFHHVPAALRTHNTNIRDIMGDVIESGVVGVGMPDDAAIIVGVVTQVAIMAANAIEMMTSFETSTVCRILVTGTNGPTQVSVLSHQIFL
jgi:hypothetical protein